MDIKGAVRIAKEFVQELFADEGISNLSLEEIEHIKNHWNVTIGFDRPISGSPNALTQMTGQISIRQYRVVSLRESGEVVSAKIREVQG
jgi:hypothetical protein